MKHYTKMRALLCVLMAVVLIMPILIGFTVKRHSDELSTYYSQSIENNLYKKLKIYDVNGVAIYDGKFSKDEAMRLSTFHIVGDKNGGVTNSLLTSVKSDSEKYSKKSGFATPEKYECHLTIDSDLQKGAYTLLTNKGYDGCVIVADYQSGEIKASVSTPTVDVLDSSRTKDEAYLNKAVQAYVPGSVFKAITYAAMLESTPTAKSFTYTCTGKNAHVSCYAKTAHRLQTLDQIIANSCNCGVAQAANTFITAGQLESYIDNTGIFDSDIVLDLNLKESSLDAYDDLMWTVNGQSKDLVTPLAVTSFYSAIANGGVRKTLYLNQNSEDEATEDTIMSEDTAEYISDALYGVTKNSGINCAAFGKTGTAETGNDTSHSWFVCCLTEEEAPKYTVLVFLKNGGSSQNAKYLARDLINHYILKGD